MRRRAALLAAGVAFFLIGAGQAAAAIQVSISSPSDGAHSLQDTVQVAVTASGRQWHLRGLALRGRAAVRRREHDTREPVPVRDPVGHEHGATGRPHADGACDRLVDALRSADVRARPRGRRTCVSDRSPDLAAAVDVRPRLDADRRRRARAPSRRRPFPSQLDGAPIASPWNTTTATDGSHTLEATVSDDRSKTGSDSETVVVDNTAPTTSVTAPSANAFATGLLAATANASDAFGIQGVRFAIDGAPVGAQIVQPDAPGGFSYSATLDISTLANGAHTLTSIASDGAGNKSTSAGVTFNVGGAPPGVTVTVPLDWSFAHRTVPVAATVTGGEAPFSAKLLVDGAVVGSSVTNAPYTFQWDTTKVRRRQPYRRRLGDGQPESHGDVRDPARDRSTMRRRAAVMYQPQANARINGPTSLQVQASDAYGIKSVRFTVDGAPVGALVSAADTGQLYLYTVTYDTSQLAAGAHAVSAIVTDNAGNTTTPAPVTILTGPIKYLPVLNYHSIAPPDGYSIYDQTLAEADQQLAYLKANGYQAVTLEQYQQWLAGVEHRRGQARADHRR